MYTIKRINIGDTLTSVRVASLQTTISAAATRTCYAVVDDGDKIVVAMDCAGKPVLEIYNYKSAAQTVADWMNKK